MCAAALLSGAYDVSAAAAGFAAVVAMPRADLSTTEAIAAFMSCLLCRGLFSCGPTVFVHDNDAWVQRRCSARCMLRAQLLLDSPLVAMPRAEFSTTGALAARVIRLLRRDLLSCCPTVFLRDCDARVQRRCSGGRVLCAQLPPDSQVWRRWQLLS